MKKLHKAGKKYVWQIVCIFSLLLNLYFLYGIFIALNKEKRDAMMNKNRKITGNYFWNLNGEIEIWDGEKLTHVRITDEHDNLITFLDVSSCKSDKEIHIKMMECFWDYYYKKNERTYFILKKLINRFPYLTQEEHKEFFEKVLNETEHDIYRNKK